MELDAHAGIKREPEAGVVMPRWIKQQAGLVAFLSAGLGDLSFLSSRLYLQEKAQLISTVLTPFPKP
jgi:hypothetical protein